MSAVLVLLVTLGSLTDMNYLELKKQLVEDTKVPQLVVDAAGGDFDDHDTFGHPKAKNVLNKAERRLEQALVELRTQQEARVLLAAGQYEVEVPGFRYVSAISVQDSSGIVKPLRPRTWSWLINLYGKIWSAISSAIPLYWTRGVPDFLLDTTSQFDAVPVEEAGAGSSDYEVSTPEAVLPGVYTIAYSATPTSEGPLTFDGWVEVVDADGNELYGRLSFQDAPVNAAFTDSIEVTVESASVITFRMSAEASGGGPQTLTFTALSMTANAQPERDCIVILPPADEDYTLLVKGGYFANEFQDDEDETWFSANASGALLLMARGYVELDVFHNFASFQRFEAQAILEAKEVWHNKVWEQVTSTPREERRIHPISFYDLRT